MNPTPSTTTPVAPQAGGPASTSDEVRAQARDVAQTAKGEVAHVGGEVKSQASRLINDVRDKARERATSQVPKVSGSLRRVSSELDEMVRGASDGSGYLAGLARDGSSVARRLSERLDRDGVEGALDEVKRFARRRPAAFLAGAFGVGIVLGRLTRNTDVSQLKEDVTSTGETTPGSGGSIPGAGIPGTTATTGVAGGTPSLAPFDPTEGRFAPANESMR